jgi:hypothetical protein
MQNRYAKFVVFSLSVFVIGCAQIVAPTGGLKDELPPKVLSITPANESVLFSAKKIVFNFDEYVQISNAASQIVISPPLEEKPEIVVAGKSVQLFIREKLLPQTTYSINFGNAIKDVHEGNILSNFVYSFSTGSYIDSFIVSGKCLHAFNKQLEKEVLVGLYHDSGFHDSLLRTTKPIYFTKSLSDGTFRIQNLPSGKFRLFAFSDDNKNLKYEIVERIGFYPVVLNTNDTTNADLEIVLFTPDVFKKNALLDTLATAKGKFNFVFYQPEKITIQNSLKLPQFVYPLKGKSGFDTIVVYINDTAANPDFFIQTPDTSYVIHMRKAKSNKVEEFSLNINKTVDIQDTINIQLKTPIGRFDTSQIVLKEDSIPLVYQYLIDSIHNQLRIVYPWKEGLKYQLNIDDSAVFDVYHQTNQKNNLSWTCKTIRDYASLQLTITGIDSAKNYIIEFWDDAEAIRYYQYFVSKQTFIQLPYVLPNILKVKIIDDLNNNRKWDNGNYVLSVMPEPVYYTGEPVKLRAYWDLELTLDLSKYVR